MRELIHAMRFTGKAAPASADGTVLRAETTASSPALTVTVDAQDLAGELRPVAGGLITSSYFVSGGLEITDHHFGVIFVP